MRTRSGIIIFFFCLQSKQKTRHIHYSLPLVPEQACMCAFSRTHTHTPHAGVIVSHSSPVGVDDPKAFPVFIQYLAPKNTQSLTHIDASSRIKYKGSWAQTYAPTGPSLPGAARLPLWSDLDSPGGWTTGCGVRRWAGPGILSALPSAPFHLQHLTEFQGLLSRVCALATCCP